MAWRGKAAFAAPLCQSAGRSSIPFLVHPCLSRFCVFPDRRFFSLYPLRLFSICALFVNLAHWCFQLRPDSPCRGSVFVYGRFSIYLMWLGECHALVVDLSFPLLPCKTFGVPLRVLLFRCFNAGMEIYGYVYHADMLERRSLVLYCLDLTKDFASRSRPVHCSSR